MVHALEILKKEGVWIVGAVPAGGKAPWDVDLTGPICLVLGGEGEGLRPLVARSCDFLVTLPMRGRLGSLNVSAAAAVLCYEVVAPAIERAAAVTLQKYSLTCQGLSLRVKFCDCWRSSGVEQLPCKQWVGGSNPPASASYYQWVTEFSRASKRGDTQVAKGGRL